MAQNLKEMEEFIRIANRSMSDPEEIIDSPVEEILPLENDLLEDLKDLEFKLNSYREDSIDQSYAKGVEQGMETAAAMIAHLISRYSA